MIIPAIIFMICIMMICKENPNAKNVRIALANWKQEHVNSKRIGRPDPLQPEGFPVIYDGTDVARVTDYPALETKTTFYKNPTTRWRLANGDIVD